MLKQITEHDRNEGNYNVFVPEIKEEESGEYDLRTYYIFLKMRIVSRVRGLKENLYMDGMVRI